MRLLASVPGRPRRGRLLIVSPIAAEQVPPRRRACRSDSGPPTPGSIARAAERGRPNDPVQRGAFGSSVSLPAQRSQSPNCTFSSFNILNGDSHGTLGRGGRTLLTFSDDPAGSSRPSTPLALAVHEVALGKLTVERVDGEHILGSPLASALGAAGFDATPGGLRLRR